MTKAAPWGWRWRSKTPFIITTIALGLFTDLFLYGLPVPLLPYILKDRLNLPETKIQSLSSSLLASHALTSAVFCPVAGILTDKSSGRKLPYLTGVLLLLLATILFFLGDSVATLVIARVLQGTSGALVWTVGQAFLIDTVGARNVGKATGSVCHNCRRLRAALLTMYRLDYGLHFHRHLGRTGARWHSLPPDRHLGTTGACLFTLGSGFDYAASCGREENCC